MTTARADDGTVPTTTSYLALADELAAEIEGYEPGRRLASEHELAARHGVSRITARSALQELEQRHLVRRSRGSGTFVALRIPYAIRAGMSPSWSQNVLAAGHEPTYEIRTLDTIRAPAEVARELLIERGRPVVHLVRTALVDGDVAAHQMIWLPASLVPGLDRLADELAAQGSLAAALVDRYGLRPERWWSQAEMTAVPPDIGRELELVGRPPAWRIESVNRCAVKGRPIELHRGWMRADCFRVRLELGPVDGTAGRSPRRSPR